MHRIFVALFVGLGLGSILNSCQKDKILLDSGARLKFSADTLFFDTVFSTVGSTSRRFLVRNTYKQPITISRIQLAGGQYSPFRINIDGLPTINTTDIQIAAKDSMYIFVKVTVNPNNTNNPILLTDSILFDFNGNRQHVILEALGQDVYLHKPTSYILFSDGSSVPYSIVCNQTWTNDKPHVVYKYLVVDSACTLTMQPGTRVYMHNGSVLWIYSGGTLVVQGNYSQRVTFSGDRLENDYRDLPGQWGNIWLSRLSKNNVIDWAVIKNGSIGILADTVNPPSGNPTLRLSNTIIKSMSVAGIYGRGASIRAYNVAISNCGQYCAALSIGGMYSFRQCSFGNYYSKGSRTTPAILLNNWYTDVFSNVQRRHLDSAHFYNCIVYGSLINELVTDSSTNGGFRFRYRFDHCILKTNLNTSNPTNFILNVINQDPGFWDGSNNSLNLISASSARGAGSSALFFIPRDLNNNPRPTPPAAQDAGAYQFVP